MTTELERLKSRIVEEISERGWNEDHPLPSNEELSQVLRCSPEAVAEAMDLLVQSGMLSSDAGGRKLIAPFPMVDEEDSFSLSRSATVAGKAIITQVREQQMRPAVRDDIDQSLALLERRAQVALGLSADEPLIVIVRLRSLEDGARAIQRAYLDPKRFPQDFVRTHDFAVESLIHTYRSLSFTLMSRDTILTARVPTVAERVLLGIHSQPVLGAEQSLIATGPTGGTPFVLEYMQACYFRWRYRIANRTTPP